MSGANFDDDTWAQEECLMLSRVSLSVFLHQGRGERASCGALDQSLDSNPC